MFSDWSIGPNTASLDEYYKTLFAAQANAHGEDYMYVHDEIVKWVPECESYTELGVNQGVTLAAVMLKKCPKIRAIDIKLDAYNPAKHHFESFAKENGIDFGIVAADTLRAEIEPTDLMYIDTVHRVEHLRLELVRHANKVKKYIVFHDTTISQGKEPLNLEVKRFVKANPEWEVVTECTINVGYMTIKRK